MWNGGYDAGNANATLARNPTTGTARSRCSRPRDRC